MPGSANKSFHLNHSYSVLHVSTSGSITDSRGAIRSGSCRDEIDFSQLRKFWGELSYAARRDLLRIDKQALFEQVRKNLYCSRCNGLLLEGFSQIILHGKNLQGGSLCHGDCTYACNKAKCDRRTKLTATNIQDDVRDPSVHPWGGLTATRDSMLTLLDCFLDGQPLEVLQNVFDSARARERERELLYPGACGGGGRGWISQGNGSSCSGRGHNLKETCTLHTARLSCDALVDFWSALGDETRRSLLRMKEEDFIERLMFSRFDSKRFCRDCRRNVLREFKEIKELKRSRKEPMCTRWFCTADTALRYEVSNTYVQVDWRECFGGDVGSIFQHFEWGLGSAEGNSDILGFEDVGLSEGARVDGLDLGCVSACYITLRAWKHDGRCTEVSVKAHALKGHQCVHRRLIVGDGYVTITKGESIKRFFEQAEEAEEEEDDDNLMDKDGSEPESEGSRFQKHAKSPELARDFLLDAATVIFKEQVERAFREGTARQNAHTIFVCLALSLLEERVHVACKEISTLEKQNQLLEEEEHQKQEEEQKRERKRLKEKEKRLRRKEKLKRRELDKEKVKGDTLLAAKVGTDCDGGAGSPMDENEDVCSDDQAKEFSRVDGLVDDLVELSSSPSTVEDLQSSAGAGDLDNGSLGDHDLSVSMDDIEDTLSTQDGNGAFIVEQSKAARRRSKIRKGPFMETVSRRLLRRSSLNALESHVPSRSCIQSTFTPVRGMTDKQSRPPHRHNAVSYKSDKNSGPRWTEGWNRRFEQRQTRKTDMSQNLESTLCQRHNDAGRAGNKFSRTKKPEKETAPVACPKQAYKGGNCVSGSLQCNWKIMKPRASTSSGQMNRGRTDQHCLATTGSFSETSKVEKVSPPIMLNETEDDVKTQSTLGNCSLELQHQRDNSLSENCLVVTSSSEHVICGCDDSTSLTGVKKDDDLFSAKCSPKVLESLTIPATELESLSNDEQFCRLGCLSSGSPDEDATPSSATSCVTDTGDSSTVDSMTSENAFALEANFPSQMAASTECLPSFRSKCQDSVEEDMHCGNDFLETTSLTANAVKHPGECHPFIATGNVSCPELHSYSRSPDLLAYSHGHSIVYGHCHTTNNLDVAPINLARQDCLMDSTQLLPASLLPLQAPQHFVYSWVQGRCASVMNPGLLAFPHPQSSLPGTRQVGFGPPSCGLSTALLQVPSAFQPLQPVLGFSCMHPFPADKNFMQLRDRSKVSKVEGKTASTVMEDHFRQNSSSQYGEHAKEHLLDCAGSTDADQILTSQLTDTPGFSLFHFGGLAGAVEGDQESSVFDPSEETLSENLRLSTMPCRSMEQEAAGVTKLNMPVEEYSLFAATPGNRFGFF